jgi:hypothetical protein
MSGGKARGRRFGFGLGGAAGHTGLVTVMIVAATVVGAVAAARIYHLGVAATVVTVPGVRVTLDCMCQLASWWMR